VTLTRKVTISWGHNGYSATDTGLLLIREPADIRYGTCSSYFLIHSSEKNKKIKIKYFTQKLAVVCVLMAVLIKDYF